MFAATGPLGPWIRQNSIRLPGMGNSDSRELTAEIWSRTSFLPSEGVMKPLPLRMSKLLTIPVILWDKSIPYWKHAKTIPWKNYIATFNFPCRTSGWLKYNLLIMTSRALMNPISSMYKRTLNIFRAVLITRRYRWYPLFWVHTFNTIRLLSIL